MQQMRTLSRVAVILWAFAPALGGQQSSSSVSAQPSFEASSTEGNVPTLHEGTHLVVLDVVVTDKKGHTVPGLSQGDFHIFEDGREQAVKFFEEHAPADPALVAKQKAELAARLPANTFTNYEPFTGTPPLLLLLNELLPLPDYDYEPLYQRMLEIVQRAPPETPFVVYELDSQLRLAQAQTTNREAVMSTVKRLWDRVHFSPLEAHSAASPALVVERRGVFLSAMRQLVAAFAPTGNHTTIFAFTGGLRCSLSSSPTCDAFPTDELHDYLCNVMDVLEQGRMSIYRYYPDGQIAYGFACDRAKMSTLQQVLDTNSHYYTFYYTPTDADWNGRYRSFKVDMADRNLRASYRKGYYGRLQNIAAGHYAAATDVPGMLSAAGREMKVTALADGSASGGAEGAGEGDMEGAASPAPVVFTVQVVPAAEPGTGPAATPPAPVGRESEGDRAQGYRDYTLNFLVPAAGLRIVRELKAGATPAYTARLQVAAVSYERSSAMDAKTGQFTATFDGPNDPRIAKGEITASLTLQVPEKGKRLLHVLVRDVHSGQEGMLDIPVEQIVLPGR